MTNSQTLEALVFDLILEVYELSARMKASEQLSNFGNYAVAHEQMLAANASSARILELSSRIEAVAGSNGRAVFGISVDSLLQQLPRNLGASTKVQLQAFEEALGLPAGATIYTLRTKANTGIERSQSEELWKIAFMVGLATIAAAGVGAPLAALATHQAIGQKVLEEAIITFGSVAIVETAIAIKNRNQGNPSIRQPPWAANQRRNRLPGERSWQVKGPREPAIGTNTDHLLVPQRGGSTKAQEEAERIIARHERKQAALGKTQRDEDLDPPNQWKAAGPQPDEQPDPQSATARYFRPDPPGVGGISGPSVTGPSQ